MRAPVFVSLLLILAPCSQCTKEFCNTSLRTKVGAGKLLKNGTLQSTKDGALYPKGTFWKDENATWACPCLLGHCIRICAKKIVSALETHWNITLEIGTSNSSIQIWEKKREREVVIEEQFKIVRDAKCRDAILLNPNDNDGDKFEFFLNGSIYFPNPYIQEKYRLFPPDQICIIPLDEQDSRTVLCSAELKKPLKFAKYVIYPALFIARAIFLLLTLIALYHSPNLLIQKNLHVRSMVCQSASMLIIGLTINYMRDSTVAVPICISVTYIYYYFSMATSFWLNIMCVDIFLTFKGTIAQKKDINFLYPSLYAWGVPALFTTVVITLNLTSHDEGALSPGIGLHLCWFQGFWSEMVFYNIPLGILLTINLILFCMTARQLRLLRRDSQNAFRGASRKVHAPPGQSHQNKSQFAIYFKLFLLMGVTWIAELILWAVRGADRYWLITDTVNCLRGALIFWFCVWSNENERKHFLSMFLWCKKPAVQVAPDTTGRDASRTSIVSTTSTTA